MDKDNALVLVTPDDIAFLEAELAKTRRPFSLHELTEKLAFLKTAGMRMDIVKVYDPNCAYEIGDSVYKDYDELLTVSSKTHEPFRGAVVLKVVRKILDRTLNCEMLEVDYAGGGVFRRYVDYMTKTKTRVLLPSNFGLTGIAPQVMGAGEDPRLTELPMTDRDIKTLEHNLRAAMVKSPAFFAWADHWQLRSDPPSVPDETIAAIEARVAETGQSAATTELVRSFFGLEPSSDRFDFHCLWLNHLLETKHKKEFIQVSPLQWGKWHLKRILNAMSQGLPLATLEAPLPEFDPAEKILPTPVHEVPLKVYLGWREILSGGVKIPRWYNKELGHSLEYVFTDKDDNKSTTVYYFPKTGYFLGLRDFFAAAAVPQGTSLTLEKTGPVHFTFWIKKSKKKIAVAKVAYDAAADAFTDAGETATLALPNKIIYIERDHLARIAALTAEREGKDLRDLLIMVFKAFSVHSAGAAVHYLRAYHLVDLLRRTTQEEVELTLLSTPAFEKSDKKKGAFFYRLAPPTKAEAVPIAFPAEPAAEEPAAGLSPEEMALAAIAADTPEPIDEVAVADVLGMEVSPEEEARRAALAALDLDKKAKVEREKEKAAPAAVPKKEKEKKKIKIEADRRPKTRKSERRVLEEEIQEEESEKEALFALKEGEGDILTELGAMIPGEEEPEEKPEAAEPEPAEHEAEAAAEEAPEEAEAAPPAAAPGGLFGGMFADKLKAALKKKRAEEALEQEGGDEEKKEG